MSEQVYGGGMSFFTFAIVIYVLLVIAVRSGCLGPYC